MNLPAIKRERARRNLAEFMKQGWHVVEPGRELIWSQHIDAMCLHLEAQRKGLIQNLAINIPAGCTKSMLIGVFLPAWVWIDDPEYRFLCFANNEKLALVTSRHMRKLVESEWYRAWGMDWQLEGDQNAKMLYTNTRVGHRQALGVRANISGLKAHWIIGDDPNDAKKVQSQADRDEVNGKWDHSIYDRLIDFNNGKRTLIGHRGHQDDLFGHVKKSGEFEFLTIPEEFEERRRCRTSIGWTDWRVNDGELLRPKEFGSEKVAAAKKRLGILYRAKHQQDPTSAEGYRFKAKHFRYWRWCPDSPDYIILHHGDAPPYRFHATNGIRFRFITADGAASAKTSADPTVVSSWLVTQRNDLVWIGCRRGNWEIPDQPAVLKEEYHRNGAQWADIEAALANVGLYQLASREKGMIVNAVSPKGQDKLARATPALILCEGGRLWFPDDEAAERVEFPLEIVQAEMLSFTGIENQDAHDDIVDTLAYAVRRLNDHDDGREVSAPSVVVAPTPAAAPSRAAMGGAPVKLGSTNRPGIRTSTI